ncbi:MAG TPA: hypothetical protein VGS41_10500, partial [Chthonomonadales bacterium]|nr:hypothetical protein [Chthonomonadales bacterium]
MDLSRRSRCRFVVGLLLLIASCAGQAHCAAQQPGPAGAQSAETKSARLARTAAAYIKQGKPLPAILALKSACGLAPTNLALHRELAAAYGLVGYLDLEIAELETVRLLKPDDADSCLRLSSIYLQLGWYKIARDRLMQGRGAAPDDPRVYIILATQAYMRFLYGPMEQAALAGVARWPRNAQLLVLFSEAERLLGRLAQAESALRRAIACTESSARKEAAYVGLARLFVEPGWNRNRAGEAAQAARKALSLSPYDVDARYWLGRALELSGDASAAEREYAYVAKRNPDLEAVTLRLARLYLRGRSKKMKAAGAELAARYNTISKTDEQFEMAHDAVRD